MKYTAIEEHKGEWRVISKLCRIPFTPNDTRALGLGLLKTGGLSKEDALAVADKIDGPFGESCSPPKRNRRKRK